jgi:hypothetical protein
MTTANDRKRMTFRERLAWLGRMPRHYKLLFGSQLLISVFAVRMRYKLIEKQKERDESTILVPVPVLTTTATTPTDSTR